MHGRDLGVNPDDLVETAEVEQEAKQEILENKDVSSDTEAGHRGWSHGDQGAPAERSNCVIQLSESEMSLLKCSIL